mgnify:CR=1 FL=1
MLSTQYRLRLESICRCIANKEEVPPSASSDLEVAKLALEDRNGQAFERAMSRALTALKMKKGFDSKRDYGGWSVLLESDEVPVVDLTGD